MPTAPLHGGGSAALGLGELGGRLADLTAQMDELRRCQARVEQAVGGMSRDLVALPSKLLRGLAQPAARAAPPAAIDPFAWPPAGALSEGGGAAEIGRAAWGAPTAGAAASPRRRKTTAEREAGARPLCADFELCCGAPSAAPKPRPPQAPPVVELRCPSPCEPVRVARGPAPEPSGAGALQRSPSTSTHSESRQLRAKAWQRNHRNSASVGDLACVEGWNTWQARRSMSSIEESVMGLQTSQSDPQDNSRSRCQRILSSFIFENLCIVLVLASSVLQGYQVQYTAERLLEVPPEEFRTANLLFTLAFCVEVGLRAYASRMEYFRGSDVWWNLFDLIIVSSSVLELVLEFAALESETGSTSVQALRVLRILRVVRVVRIIRVLRFFKELRMMVYSIIGSVRSLFWAIMLVFIVLFTVASYLTQVATNYRATASEDDELAGELTANYGTLLESIYVLFQAVSGGADWGDVANPLLELHWAYAVFFIVFMCFALFAVLNVVTGVFVEGALERAAMDKEAMIQHELDSQQSNVKNLEQTFRDIDTDGSGILELAEFERLVEDPRVKAWFRSMGLHVETAMHLFRLLDLDNSNTVSSSEFVMGCLRLQGGAKNVDVATLMYENKRMMMKWTAFMDFVEERFDEVKAHVSTTASATIEALLQGHFAQGSLPAPALRGGTGAAERQPAHVSDSVSVEQHGRRKSWREYDETQGSLNVYGGDFQP